MNSFMDLIYIDSEDQARHTGLRRALGSDAATWAEFRQLRRYAVDIKTACFLLDYHNRKGDLCDTIPIDRAGFKAITGQHPGSEAHYRRIDTQFWNEVAKEAA